SAVHRRIAKWRGLSISRRGAPGRGGRQLEAGDQAGGVAVKILEFTKARAARGEAADVSLDLLHLVKIQLSVEQGVQCAFVKMRHCSLDPARDTLRPVAAGPAPR